MSKPCPRCRQRHPARPQPFPVQGTNEREPSLLRPVYAGGPVPDGPAPDEPAPDGSVYLAAVPEWQPEIPEESFGDEPVSDGEDATPEWSAYAPETYYPKTSDPRTPAETYYPKTSDPRTPAETYYPKTSDPRDAPYMRVAYAQTEPVYGYSGLATENTYSAAGDEPMLIGESSPDFTYAYEGAPLEAAYGYEIPPDEPRYVPPAESAYVREFWR